MLGAVDTPLGRYPTVVAVIGDTTAASVARATLGEGFEIFAVPLTGDAGAPHLIDRVADAALLIVVDDEELSRVLQPLRGTIAVPLIVMTPGTSSDARALALELGADDAVCTTFAASEIRARIFAAIRRTGKAPQRTLQLDDCEIDVDAMVVRRGGETVHVSPTEFALLLILARRKGGIVARDVVERELWGAAQAKADGKLNTLVSTLRAKLDRPPHRPLIRTVHRVGYALRI